MAEVHSDPEKSEITKREKTDFKIRNEKNGRSTCYSNEYVYMKTIIGRFRIQFQFFHAWFHVKTFCIVRMRIVVELLLE